MNLTEIRTAIACRLAVKRAQRLLVSELASYNTPAQQLDFQAQLDEYPDEQTKHIRDALARAL